jgi:single-strand DNA-binding protein
MATKSLNRAQIIGNLGAEPELKMLNSGMAVCNLAVATSESWTDKNTGELKEATEWHRITLWGKLAEIANQYLHKGDKVFIEGKLKTRKWQDQNGNDRYSTEIHGDNLLMLGGKSQGGDGGGGQGYAQTPSGYQTPGPGYQTQGQGPGPVHPPAPAGQGFGAPAPAERFDFDDDIPF